MDLWNSDKIAAMTFEKRSAKTKIPVWSLLIITLPLLGPVLWFISDFETDRSRQAGLVAIPCLLIIGFMWGYFSREDEVHELASSVGSR
ncbi:hypothetical protein [Bifidobacterium fermentum]